MIILTFWTSLVEQLGSQKGPWPMSELVGGSCLVSWCHEEGLLDAAALVWTPHVGEKKPALARLAKG